VGVCLPLPDRDRAFRSITARVPFHIGLTLLRIARNDWIEAPHRQRLIREAMVTLRDILNGHSRAAV